MTRSALARRSSPSCSPGRDFEDGERYAVWVLWPTRNRAAFWEQWVINAERRAEPLLDGCEPPNGFIYFNQGLLIWFVGFYGSGVEPGFAAGHPSRDSRASCDPRLPGVATVTTTRFLLLRHAEATGNLGGQTQGRIDNQLTDRGRLQATTVPSSLAPYSPVALYVSPASRARGTAAPIAEAYHLAPVIDERLHEVDHGDLDGMGFDEIREHFADFLEQWRDETFADLRFPGGESMGEARVRMIEVLDEAGGAARRGRCRGGLAQHGAEVAAHPRPRRVDGGAAPLPPRPRVAVGGRAPAGRGRRTVAVVGGRAQRAVPPAGRLGGPPATRRLVSR